MAVGRAEAGALGSWKLMTPPTNALTTHIHVNGKIQSRSFGFSGNDHTSLKCPCNSLPLTLQDVCLLCFVLQLASHYYKYCVKYCLLLLVCVECLKYCLLLLVCFACLKYCIASI